ncbi:hypothetical protein GX48_07854 [Paracoccidioides brasiliensis]|nr:hypothetical protein GX48_07854 [Paracoccidioides brasiliensis]
MDRAQSSRSPQRLRGQEPSLGDWRASGRTAKGQRKRQRGGCRLGAADVAADDADAAAAAADDDDDAVARWSGPSGEEAKGEKMPEGETSQPREHAKSHARRQ